MALNGKTLTRADLAEAVFEKVGLPRNEAAELVELVLKQIVYALERGEPIKLSSFGSFGLRQKSERVGRNPKTGEIVPITPRRVIVFKASNIMKDRINAGLAKVVPPPPAVKIAPAKTTTKAGAKTAAASKAGETAKPKPAKASAKAAPVEEKPSPEQLAPKVEAKPKAAKADVAKPATKAAPKSAAKEASPKPVVSKAAAKSDADKTKAEDAAPKRASAPKASSSKKRVVSS
ncbi:integration host factor subunit alpha [Rhodomicrobium udaipurense JA643]|uniref:Integration host factor subunit alpha n=1 Tax=Rhodomicrobium udaipurense TaxID=1202716 RepID=A0A8I1GEQ6_9HYPH|nr:integration host factor subunit alpha [Rhodomicrobium udaipurense JA643]MBJ7544650.1 integration host factor subunit alpha [Rhodomicrobium udaipurense]